MKRILATIALFAACSFYLNNSIIAQEATEEDPLSEVSTEDESVDGTTETEEDVYAGIYDVTSSYDDEGLSDYYEEEEGVRGKIDQLNYMLGEKIGMTLVEPMDFLSFVIRFFICFIVVAIIARCFYFPTSKRRDYMFIFIIMSMSIFMLVSLMGGGAMKTGAALGLFAIFGIIRYRTEAIPIREMTYLFMLVAVSVVNAMGKAEYHHTADYWDGMGIVTLVFANIVFILLAALFETNKILNEHCSKYIKYDNVTLVSPEKRPELIADLEKRTGLKIVAIEVGTIDFLKDSVILRIYYDEDMDRGSSIQDIGRMPKLK